MKTIIVGGVAAGMSAATRLRRLQEDGDITVYEMGENVSYANCGLPYYVGGVIEERDALLLQTPESLHRRFRLDEAAVAEFAQAREITPETIAPDFARNPRIHRCWELRRP